MLRALWPSLLATVALSACGQEGDGDGCKRSAVGSSSYACGAAETKDGDAGTDAAGKRAAPATPRRPGMNSDGADADGEKPRANGSVAAADAEAPPPAEGALDGGCYETDADACALQLAMVDSLNAFRKENGLGPLRYSVELSYAAHEWSGEQESVAEISHDGFPAARQAILKKVFPALGRVFVAGENVARGWPTTHEPGAVAAYLTEMWANSPGHRANMLNPDFVYVGLGAVVSDDGQMFATQIFGRD
jgi:uncharacterized protein YkwD